MFTEYHYSSTNAALYTESKPKSLPKTFNTFLLLLLYLLPSGNEHVKMMRLVRLQYLYFRFVFD